MKIGKAGDALRCVFKVQQTVEFKMSGENRQGGNYKYFTLEDLIVPVKPVLAEHNCVLLFSTDTSDVRAGFEKIQGNKDAVPRDKLVTYAYCTVTARIQSIADMEDFVESNCFGYKVDQTADKALGADTVANRYALMHLFLAGSDIDPDSSEHDVRSSGLLGSLVGNNTPAVSQPTSPYNNAPVASLASLMAQDANSNMPQTQGANALQSALSSILK